MQCDDGICARAMDTAYDVVDWNTTNVTSLTSLINLTLLENSTSNEGIASDVSEEFKTGLFVLFTFTTLLSIVGNAFVVLVFSKGRHSRTDLRPFLINLAVADLIMAIFCMPFTFFYTMMNTWIFSKPMCPIVLYVQVISVSASVFTNTAIGLDRFLVVMFPLRSRLTKKKAKYVILTIWICAAALSSVQIKVGQTQQEPNGAIHCREHWDSRQTRQIYTIVLFVLTYVIPLLILSVTYTLVGTLLWRRTAPGNRDHTRDMNQLRSKRKVVKMLVIVVAIFGFCWLPLQLFTLILDFFPEVIRGVSMETLTSLYISCHWLAMSNSFANPIIYGFTNESFRADLVTLFYMWFPCCVFLTKMLPRQSSGSTYSTVVFRRQSLCKQGAKINGTYHTRTVRGAISKNYLNSTRGKKLDYNSIKKPDVKMDTNRNCHDVSRNGCELTGGQRVILAYDSEHIRLEPVSSAHSVSDNSEDDLMACRVNEANSLERS